MNSTSVDRSKKEIPRRKLLLGLGIVLGGLVAFGGTAGALGLFRGSAKNKFLFFRRRNPKAGPLNEDSIFYPRDEAVRKRLMDSHDGGA